MIMNSRNEEYLYPSGCLMEPGHVLQGGWSVTSSLREFVPEMEATLIGPHHLEMDPPSDCSLELDRRLVVRASLVTIAGGPSVI